MRVRRVEEYQIDDKVILNEICHHHGTKALDCFHTPCIVVRKFQDGDLLISNPSRFVRAVRPAFLKRG